MASNMDVLIGRTRLDAARIFCENNFYLSIFDAEMKNKRTKPNLMQIKSIQLQLALSKTNTHKQRDRHQNLSV